MKAAERECTKPDACSWPRCSCEVKRCDVIDTGDRVRHRPSGEEWLVARVVGEQLHPCGWPPSRALLSDCALIKRATADERLQVLQELAAGQGEHAGWAREAVQGLQVVACPGCAPPVGASTVSTARSWRSEEAGSDAGATPNASGRPADGNASGETMEQREEVCAAWHALPDELRKDPRLTRLYHALGGPRMDDPAEADTCGVPEAPAPCAKCKNPQRCAARGCADRAATEPAPMPAAAGMPPSHAPSMTRDQVQALARKVGVHDPVTFDAMTRLVNAAFAAHGVPACVADVARPAAPLTERQLGLLWLDLSACGMKLTLNEFVNVARAVEQAAMRALGVGEARHQTFSQDTPTEGRDG